MKNAFSAILLFTTFLSCKKDRDQNLPTGNYIGNFYGHTVKSEDGTPSEYEQNDLNVKLIISKITDTSIVINGIDLYKNDHLIEGPVPVGDGSGGYDIYPQVRGVWSKEKGAYYIRGGYTAINTVGWSVSGTFEIKSDF